MVKFNKCGNIQWTKEEKESLMSLYEENPHPTLTDRLKLAEIFGISTAKITNWFRGQRRKIKSSKELKVPNLLKRRKNVSKSNKDDSKIQLLGPKSNEQNEVFLNMKKSSIKLKSSNEKVLVIQEQTDAKQGKHNVSLKSNTDANFLDRSVSNFSNYKSPEAFHQCHFEPIFILSKPNNTSGQAVDFRNIESLISDNPNTDATIQNSGYQATGWTEISFYPKALDFDNDDLEEILDLHVDMISESNFDDDNDDFNAYQPVAETVSFFV